MNMVFFTEWCRILCTVLKWFFFVILSFTFNIILNIMYGGHCLIVSLLIVRTGVWTDVL